MLTYKTRQEASAYRYGRWGGDTLGRAYDSKRCAFEVHTSTIAHQCRNTTNKWAERLQGLYCQVHYRIIKRLLEK